MTDSIIERNKMRTSYYISKWGVPKDIIVKKTSKNFDISIVEFQKSSKNDYYRYITNGLSELIGKNSKIRNEIYAISESQSKLIPELLFNLVEYSFLYECTFYDLDSIIINNKEFNSFGYYHVLFAPPLLVEPEIIDEITDIFDNPIRIEMVIGLTNEEFLSYEKNGGEFLIESLKKDISSLALDKKRVL